MTEEGMGQLAPASQPTVALPLALSCRDYFSHSQLPSSQALWGSQLYLSRAQGLPNKTLLSALIADGQWTHGPP